VQDLYFTNLAQCFTERIQSAERNILVVSPFISSTALKYFLSKASTELKIQVVTRWGMRDVLSGVSDPEVYPLVKSLGGQVFHCPNLHSKYYRFDESVLVGSANVTKMGFSINGPGNLETLVEIDVFNQEMKSFEAYLLQRSREIDDDFYSLMKEMAALDAEDFFDESASNVDAAILTKNWWPTTLRPEVLWLSYSNQESFIAESDLASFVLPTGLSEDLFRKSVYNQMKDIPTIQKVLEFVDGHERRFGEMRIFVKNIDPDLECSTETWKSLFKWLLYFSAGKYEYFRPNYTEIIRIRKP
jgi:hypothetical protein